MKQQQKWFLNNHFRLTELPLICCNMVLMCPMCQWKGTRVIPIVKNNHDLFSKHFQDNKLQIVIRVGLRFSSLLISGTNNFIYNLANQGPFSQGGHTCRTLKRSHDMRVWDNGVAKWAEIINPWSDRADLSKSQKLIWIKWAKSLDFRVSQRMTPQVKGLLRSSERRGKCKKQRDTVPRPRARTHEGTHEGTYDNYKLQNK